MDWYEKVTKVTLLTLFFICNIFQLSITHTNQDLGLYVIALYIIWHLFRSWGYPLGEKGVE